MNLDLSKIKKIFFIGIGGIGISALAKFALAKGMEVSGINDEDTPDTIRPLQAHGVYVIFQKDVKGVFEVPEADLYVYSDAWLYRGPEIIESARKTGKPTLSYFEALGIFAKDYKVIAVAGTHGKTTTTAMIADMLIEMGMDPTVVVGSFMNKSLSNFRKGKSEYFIVEADEYNRHFLNFFPFVGLVTNVEADHLDCYKDLADIHNIPQEVAQKSLSQFSGTARRLEKKGKTPEGAVIYDDYAHHPTEIRASLQALRELYPTQKITVLFQP